MNVEVKPKQNTKLNSNTLKLPKAYWALYHGDLIMFEGTHTECWAELLKQYSTATVASLKEANVYIGRVK